MSRLPPSPPPTGAWRLASGAVVGLAALLGAIWPEAAPASPVAEALDVPLLAEHWRLPPGDPRLLPPAGTGELRLGYDSFNLYRHSQPNALTELARIRGPALSLAYNNWDGFFALKARDYALAASWEDRGLANRLDGSQSALRLDVGRHFSLGAKQRLTLACRLERGNLALGGVLPAALERVPGFAPADRVSFGWDDENWLAALRYQHGDAALHLGYGKRDLTAALGVIGEQDDLACRLPIAGREWTAGLEVPLEQRADAELLARGLRTDGLDRIYHCGGDIGYLEADHRAQQLGLRIRDPLAARRWDFSVVAGKYSAALAGSARLSGFSGSVWGITAPRGHLDTRLRYRAVSVLLDRAGGSCGGGDWRWNLGLTRFDLDGRVDTWGTVLFGSARVDEASRALPTEAGWIGHMGLSASWPLAGGTLTAVVSQSVPFGVYKSAPDDDLPPVRESTDGGRAISVAYTVRF